VRIKTNTFRGDLHDYTIHVDIDDVKADIKLHGTVPSWRPDTGYFMFKNKDKEDYFAWLPSVPQGNVEGTITIAGQSQTVTGVGYHDHNWGVVSMLKLIHDWYWGRAQIGNYSIITSYITAADKYANTPLPVFMLARDGKIIADDSSKVKFSVDGVYTDSLTGKPVANTIVYDYNDDVNHYRITFKRDKDLLRVKFIDTLKGLKWIMAKLAGIDGAYMRFTGQVTLDRFEGKKIIETVSEKAAVWELMYFGHAPKK
jgi:predicted secreted hydrolase